MERMKLPCCRGCRYAAPSLSSFLLLGITTFPVPVDLILTPVLRRMCVKVCWSWVCVQCCQHGRRCCLLELLTTTTQACSYWLVWCGVVLAWYGAAWCGVAPTTVLTNPFFRVAVVMVSTMVRLDAGGALVSF
jgi:hypothetical protein